VFQHHHIININLSWLEQSAEENYSTNQLQQSFVSIAANYHKEPTKI
jgi:hypothetical protein